MTTKTPANWLVLSGVLAAVFYLLHVVLGQLAYPGYDWMAQAVSDLTAATAPSVRIASAFTFLYGLFSCIACVLLCVMVTGRTTTAFRLGIYLYTVMNLISYIGYTLFPLSGSGYQDQLQDFIHAWVVTLGVVLTSIASLVLIGAGGIRRSETRTVGILAFVTLGCMFTGSIAMGLVPGELFGLFERCSVFSIVVFTAILCLHGFRMPLTRTIPAQ